MSGFEAKKAFIFEIEDLIHGGEEEEDGDGEEMGGKGWKFEGREGRKG